MKMNALQVLIEDHEYVKKSYRAFQKMDHDDRDAVQALVKQVCAALKVHVRIEEEVFYPALRKALKDKDLIEEAQVEHDSAKALLRRLDRMKPRDPNYIATFTVLCEYIGHHVKDLVALGSKLMARKIKLAKPR